MRTRELCYAAVPGIAAGFLIGCGSGGGGYTTPMMPPPPPPPAAIVSFSAPAGPTKINLGQAVMLTWTSSNASSCTLSSSSTIGGMFTATQPTAGTISVAPMGTGNVTYTMTCMGANGNGAATTAAITVNPSILSMLSTTTITTIGSTIDPTEKGGNPYGLAIAPASTGLITQGDLVVCNFNDGATNTQGQGTTLVGLHPTPGAMPYRIAQSPMLLGCNALTVLPDDSISAAAYSANLNPLVTPAGTVNNPFLSA